LLFSIDALNGRYDGPLAGPGFYFNYVNIGRKKNNLVLHPASASKHIINFKDLGNAAVYVATIYTNQGNNNIF